MGGERLTRATRAWLEHELPRWREEGLLDEAALRELQHRYGLESRHHTSAVLFAVYLIGSLLIGGGLLSFVAWNWDRFPDAAKLALGAGSLIAATTIGFWLWKVDGRRALLGHSLTLLGSLLFGANIGIVSQVFQLDGEFWQAAALWGGGAALAAWLFTSVPNALLAGVLGLVWSLSAIDRWDAAWPALLPAAVLVPLAFRANSPLLFLGGTALVGIPFATASGELGDRFVHVVLSVLATSALLLAVPYALSDRFRAIRLVAAAVGSLTLATTAYVLSFHEIAEEAGFRAGDDARWLLGTLPQVAGTLLCAALAVGAGRSSAGRGSSGWVGAIAATLLAVGVFLPNPEVGLAILANLCLAILGGWAVASSMRSLARIPYWAGAALLVTTVVSRFFEYETGLLAKAVVFTLCGLAVIFAGLAFERRASRREVSHAA